MMLKLLYGVILMILALGAACSDEGDEPKPVDDACEHMTLGPQSAITAAQHTTGDVPDIDEQHTRFDIVVPHDEDGLGGYVDLVIDEAGQFIVFLNTEGTIGLEDASGNPVTPVDTNVDVADCTQVRTGYAFDLSAGTYLMTLVGSDQDITQLVIVHATDFQH